MPTYPVIYPDVWLAKQRRFHALERAEGADVTYEALLMDLLSSLFDEGINTVRMAGEDDEFVVTFAKVPTLPEND